MRLRRQMVHRMFLLYSFAQSFLEKLNIAHCLLEAEYRYVRYHLPKLSHLKGISCSDVQRFCECLSKVFVHHYNVFYLPGYVIFQNLLMPHDIFRKPYVNVYGHRTYFSV